jgi:transposase
MTRRRYSADFKREAVALVDAGNRVEWVARELGMPHGTLWAWVYRARGGGTRTSGTASEVSVPDAALPVDPLAYQAALKRIAELERENELLGKASAYFARKAHP